MATPGELVQVMADALGISEATAAQFDRQLAEAGLRSKSGRGRSAAQVTPRDAVNLLIAICASPISGLSAKEAAHTCRTYGALPVFTGPLVKAPFGQFGLPSLEQLPRKHTFADGLSKLIAAAAKGEEYGYWDEGKFVVHEALFHVRFDGPAPSAEIAGDVSVTGGAHDPRCFFLYHPTAKHQGDFYAVIKGDLHQRREVSFGTIQALGRLCA
jgi:hypothetical protein